MGYSNSSDFTMTASDVCTLALEKVGVVAENQLPTGTQLIKARQQLNLILKEIENMGYKFWTSEEKTITTVANQTSYTVDSDTAEIEYMFVRTPTTAVPPDTANYPISIITRFEEADITNKGEKGLPSRARFVRNQTSKTVNLYPVPDKAYTVFYGKSKIVQDVDISTNNPDVLSNWMNALVYGLASELADTYQLPIDERSRLEMKAAQKMQSAKSRAREFSNEVVVKGRF